MPDGHRGEATACHRKRTRWSETGAISGSEATCGHAEGGASLRPPYSALTTESRPSGSARSGQRFRKAIGTVKAAVQKFWRTPTRPFMSERGQVLVGPSERADPMSG